MSRGRRHSRAGFTLLELLLAMVIGSLVLAGGFVIVGLAERLDDRFADRLDATNRLAFVQRTIGRSLHTIIAAPENFDPQVAAQTAAQTAARIERLRQREEDGDQAAPEPGPGAPLDDIAAELNSRAVPDVPPAPPRFRMGHIDRGGQWEVRDPERAALGDRRLELLLTRPPVGEAPLGAAVRGALELIHTPVGAEDRWRLQWTPLRPAGRPTVLLEDLVLAEWSVTDSQGQFDQFEAYKASNLPWAFRIILWTESGAKVDWMFDLGAASTTGEPL